jgi:hypothetical protein
MQHSWQQPSPIGGTGYDGGYGAYGVQRSQFDYGYGRQYGYGQGYSGGVTPPRGHPMAMDHFSPPGGEFGFDRASRHAPGFIQDTYLSGERVNRMGYSSEHIGRHEGGPMRQPGMQPGTGPFGGATSPQAALSTQQIYNSNLYARGDMETRLRTLPGGE